jgi:mRNA interferase RelE/StbE
VGYEIAWTGTAKRSLQKLPARVAHAAIEFIYGAVADNPQRVGKPLRLELGGLHSARRGDFRIIYRIDEAVNRVNIVAIEYRSDAYRSRR